MEIFLLAALSPSSLWLARPLLRIRFIPVDPFSPSFFSNQAGTGAARPPVGKSGSIGLLISAEGASVGGGGSGGGFCAITGGLRM